MEKYKPQYLGKVMPVAQPALTNFMQKNYEQFSKGFDVCKDASAGITNIENVSPSDDKLVLKVSAASETLTEISGAIATADDPSVTLSGNEITVTEDNDKT